MKVLTTGFVHQPRTVAASRGSQLRVALGEPLRPLKRGRIAPIVMARHGLKTERKMRRYEVVTDQTLRAAADAVRGAEA